MTATMQAQAMRMARPATDEQVRAGRLGCEPFDTGDDLGVFAFGCYMAADLDTPPGERFGERGGVNAHSLDCELIVQLRRRLDAGPPSGSPLAAVWRAAVAGRPAPRKALAAVVAEAVEEFHLGDEPDAPPLCGLDPGRYHQHAGRVAWAAVRWWAAG